MAYKIQIGSASLSGSVTGIDAAGDISVGSNDITGSTLEVSGAVVVGTDVNVTQGGLRFSGSQDATKSKRLTVGAGSVILESSGAFAAKMILQSTNDRDVMALGCAVDDVAGWPITGFKLAAGYPYMALYNNDSTPVQNLRLFVSGASAAGYIRGEGDLQVKKTGSIAGNCTVGGDLIIQGTQIQLANSTVNVAAADVNINYDATTDSTIEGTKVQAGGMEIQYKEAAGSDSERIRFYDSGMEDFASLQASKFYGDGSNLTGLGANLFSYEVSASTGNNAWTEGVNWVDNSAAYVASLPELSDATTDGMIIIVKSVSTSTSVSNYIRINRAGSNTIDGNESVDIDAPFGAIKLVASGTAWHII